MIATLATLLVFQTLGEGIAVAFSLPIPGPVIGMLLLFCYLLARPQVVQRLAPDALALLRHLSLLFIPAGVGVMVHAHRIADEWPALLVALVVSTVASLATTALVLKALRR